MDVIWESIINKSDSSIIILAVICAVVLIALAIPLYKLKIKSNSISITTIQNNTEALTALKTAVEIHVENCKDCKTEQLSRYDKILNKQESQSDIMTKIETKLDLTTATNLQGQINTHI